MYILNDNIKIDYGSSEYIYNWIDESNINQLPVEVIEDLNASGIFALTMKCWYINRRYY